MVKHRRWSDKSKSIQKEEKTESIEQEISSPKTSKDFKSIILSGTKYMYIVVAAALLSGIFTPLTIGTDLQDVILGMWSLFVGVGGGIVIFLGIQNQKFRTVMVGGGLAMIVASFFIIHELADRSLLN
jgi:hypothetical protein|tara:strand:- start:168 stop:551 length:384 start_codon:yes stop_codon:yes gene_type:complete